MKLAIIGGGGVRVPLLVHGLLRRGLPFDEISLFDHDRDRLRVIGTLTASRTSPNARVVLADTAITCVSGADFVVTSIRVGGLHARQADEGTAIRHGLVGQETVGPAGFAMAVRTIPALTEYSRLIATHAPDAWIINFTNPVGIITQAMRRAGASRVIGICDTPTELFAEAAHALDVPVAECAFDYLGLNHLGWLRDVWHRGRPLLHDQWHNQALLSRVYSRRLFPADYLSHLRLLPTEYVFYYEFPERVVQHTRNAGTHRGRAVASATSEMISALQNDSADATTAYERYIAERSASYMQIESGASAPHPPSPWAELTGYDRIAYDVMHAIIRNTKAVIPLNVANAGNISELHSDDVIEVPCVVDGNGARALHVGSLPAAVRDLTLRVKEYERRTIAAAERRSTDAFIDALAHNPLVPSSDIAAQLVGELHLGEA